MQQSGAHMQRGLRTYIWERCTLIAVQPQNRASSIEDHK